MKVGIISLTRPPRFETGRDGLLFPPRFRQCNMASWALLDLLEDSQIPTYIRRRLSEPLKGTEGKGATQKMRRRKKLSHLLTFHICFDALVVRPVTELTSHSKLI